MLLHSGHYQELSSADGKGLKGAGIFTPSWKVKIGNEVGTWQWVLVSLFVAAAAVSFSLA